MHASSEVLPHAGQRVLVRNRPALVRAVEDYWGDRKAVTLHQTTRPLLAFRRFKEVGLEAFSQEDWQFPAEIGQQLGKRFTPWQAQGSIEQSWAKCEEHARRVREFAPPLPTPSSETEPGQAGPNGGRGGRGKRGKGRQEGPGLFD